ncbi:Type 2A phosphatase-associated protein 42 [Elasticomyces elasticus]|nr:Type 2A phosphatase-associated protein 42 [Elasticomyces elasticus]
MADQPQSLREIYNEAEAKRKNLESSWDTNTAVYQEALRSTIVQYEKCIDIADRVSIFSANETLDDVASPDLPYMLLHYRAAELAPRVTHGNRKATLSKARNSYERFLRLLDSYDILQARDARLFEEYLDAPNAFSTASKTDAAARRETKILRFKEEKELKKKLEYLQQNPLALQADDAVLRDLHLTNIAFCVHQSLQSLESIAQELHILSLAPPSPPPGEDTRIQDERERQDQRRGGYSERLDSPFSQLSAATKGPILSKDGKPLRPFTLLDKRQELQRGVFRPDHSLPTMSIDEYLEEEKRRGGMIDGGGEQSGVRPEPNEDDMDKADEETIKARAWDEFKEENPKGSGNTMNRG